MALVGYSDSESSSDEKPTRAPPPPKISKPIPASNPDAPRKIRVELPSIQPEQQDTANPPPAKRARTAGAFGGFNSLLPPPKRSGLAPGVALKTSSEAAFSRRPAPVLEDAGNGDFGAGAGGETEVEVKKQDEEEVKIIGKATRFKPLSVAHNKKKKPVKSSSMLGYTEGNVKEIQKHDSQATLPPAAATAQPAVPAPKRSLFSVHIPDDDDNDHAQQPSNTQTSATTTSTSTYKPLISNSTGHPETASSDDPHANHPPSTSSSLPQPQTLQTLASDLNLSRSQQRHLFGRSSSSSNNNNNNQNNTISITHFDLDAEYAANAAAVAAAGDNAAPARAVKTIAPGKHSLRQLVDNARGQREALEDRWAAGKQERTEAGGKYGWG